MCGFFISNSEIISSEHEEEIHKRLFFRGPDYNSGLIKYNGWNVYHSRLSIIGLDDSSNQPIINTDGSILVFNGEILNYKELGFLYFEKEYLSDTLLLNDLLKFKKLNLDELDGFFSFVFINSDGFLENAVRDKFGVKPLYYHENLNSITFCSEPSLINDIFKLGVNEEAVNEYKALRAPVFSESYFNNINLVAPGSCFVKGVYFNVLSFILKKSDSKFSDKDELKLKIKEAINTREVSDVPIALLLSKGIDSNILRVLSNVKKYYSIGFKGDEDYEYLKHSSIKNLTLIESNFDSFKRSFQYLLKLRGEPLSVPNEVLLYEVALRAKKDGYKILFSGEGADEFFAGYDKIFRWANTSNFNLNKFLELYSYTDIPADSNLYQKFKNIFDNKKDLSCFELVRWFFVRYHMPVLFRRLDFALMAAGVEGREPLANIHTFIASLNYNSNELVNSNLGKIPLRNLLSDYMESDFCFSKKVGFPVDLQNVFKTYDKTNYEIWFEKNLEILL